MQCIRCEKPLKRYAKEVTDSAGKSAGWGPTCARLAFGAKARQKAGTGPAIVSRRRGVQAGPLQIDWVQQAAA